MPSTLPSRMTIRGVFLLHPSDETLEFPSWVLLDNPSLQVFCWEVLGDDGIVLTPGRLLRGRVRLLKLLFEPSSSNTPSQSIPWDHDGEVKMMALIPHSTIRTDFFKYLFVSSTTISPTVLSKILFETLSGYHSIFHEPFVINKLCQCRVKAEVNWNRNGLFSACRFNRWSTSYDYYADVGNPSLHFLSSSRKPRADMPNPVMEYSTDRWGERVNLWDAKELNPSIFSILDSRRHQNLQKLVSYNKYISYRS